MATLSLNPTQRIIAHSARGKGAAHLWNQNRLVRVFAQRKAKLPLFAQSAKHDVHYSSADTREERAYFK